VGGKKSKRSALHVAAERNHVHAVKSILSHISSAVRRAELLNMTTVIKPEGQRPRPLTCLHIAAKCGHNGEWSDPIKLSSIELLELE